MNYGYALMDIDTEAFLKNYEEGRKLFGFGNKYMNCVWESDAKLRNPKATEIYLKKAQKIMKRWGINTKIVKFEMVLLEETR